MPTRADVHPILLRQLRRAAGIDSLDTLARRCASPEHASAVLAALPALMAMVSDAYSQFDRDLELRTRSLDLSSQELTEVNERLRAEAIAQRQVLDTLRESAREFMPMPSAEAGDGTGSSAQDVLALATLLRRLVQESRVARDELERSQALFHSAIEALNVGFVMFDENERLVICNSRFREMSPLKTLDSHSSLREVMEDFYRSGLEGVDHSQPEAAWVEERLSMHRALGTQPRVRETSIGGRWYRIDESRSPEGMRVSLRTDITDARRLTEELRAAKDAAEFASVAKSRFLANMSHELRTPLNAVIGAAQLLHAGGDDPASQAHLVEAIQHSGTNLLGLIENILDISRIEAGEMVLSNEDFHLLDCIDAALATASLAAREKGLELACIVDPQVQEWRHGDPLRVRQILLNLLGNAVKFTPSGEIMLRVSRGAGAHDLHMELVDTGVGIGEASLPHVFEPFRQADDGADRRFGGSGLGLSIVRQLVDAMGGRIGVQSALGQGTRFDIDLPLPPASVIPAPPQALDLDIAFHEPHAASAEALTAQLLRLGCRAQRIHDAQGLQQWWASVAASTDRAWLLIATDSALSPALAQSCPDPARLIGMTGGNAASSLQFMQNGCIERTVTRPVFRTSLVSQLGATRTAPGDVAAASGGILPASRKAGIFGQILVVEDDLLNQTIVCRLLANAGLRSAAASDGMQALAMLSAQEFDLVLMDWQMPEMDGIEVTRRIRSGAAGEQARSVPIIALTANAFAQDRVACLAAGMDDFLTKPILAERLLSAVRRWMGTQTAATVQQNGTPCFDPSVLTALCASMEISDTGYADELLQLFIDDTRRALDDIDASIASADLVTLRRCVHTLKSTASAVGALALAEEAGRHEAALRAGSDPDLHGLAQLPTSLAMFEQALSAWRAMPTRAPA